jgi:Uma2 family endonuclease
MSVAMEEFPRRHRITVEEYYRMAEVGLLAPDARVELIEGEIIDMPPIGTSHAFVVSRLHELLLRAVDDRAFVRGQLPVRLDEYSEPQPDLVVVARRADFYAERHPIPSDTLLAIEVSETTLRFDLRIKSPLYARHGIPEYWIFDTQRKQLHVAHHPTDTGYEKTCVVDRPASMPISTLPGITIDTAWFFE